MMRLFLRKARQQNRSIVSLCEDFGDRRLVQKELIRTIFVKNGTANGKKKEGRGVQTENNRKMCKHIKDKDSYLSSDHSFALRIGKKSAKKLRY